MNFYNELIEILQKPWWVGISAVATIIYTLLTYFLFRATTKSVKTGVKVARFNTFREITKALENEAVDKIGAACRTNLIKIVDSLPLNPEKGWQYFLKNDVRRNLISVLEDLAKYERDGLITLEDIDFGYGYFILHVGNCQEIVDYINELRSDYKNNSVYGGFEDLYTKIVRMLPPSEQLNYRPDFKS